MNFQCKDGCKGHPKVKFVMAINQKVKLMRSAIYVESFYKMMHYSHNAALLYETALLIL